MDPGSDERFPTLAALPVPIAAVPDPLAAVPLPIKLRSVLIASISARKMWGISNWREKMAKSWETVK